MPSLMAKDASSSMTFKPAILILSFDSLCCFLTEIVKSLSAFSLFCKRSVRRFNAALRTDDSSRDNNGVNVSRNLPGCKTASSAENKSRPALEAEGPLASDAFVSSNVNALSANNEYAVCNMLAFAVECAPNFFCARRNDRVEMNREAAFATTMTPRLVSEPLEAAICFHKKEEKRESRQRREAKDERVFVVVEMNFSEGKQQIV